MEIINNMTAYNGKLYRLMELVREWKYGLVMGYTNWWYTLLVFNNKNVVICLFDIITEMK